MYIDNFVVVQCIVYNINNLVLVFNVFGGRMVYTDYRHAQQHLRVLTTKTKLDVVAYTY